MANLSIITASSVIYLLEITQLELDRVLEIQEYMEQQEDIIKFRSEHYNEYIWIPVDSKPPHQRLLLNVIKIFKNPVLPNRHVHLNTPRHRQMNIRLLLKILKPMTQIHPMILLSNMHGLYLPTAVMKSSR